MSMMNIQDIMKTLTMETSGRLTDRKTGLFNVLGNIVRFGVGYNLFPHKTKIRLTRYIQDEEGGDGYKTVLSLNENLITAVIPFLFDCMDKTYKPSMVIHNECYTDRNKGMTLYELFVDMEKGILDRGVDVSSNRLY